MQLKTETEWEVLAWSTRADDSSDCTVGVCEWPRLSGTQPLWRSWERRDGGRSMRNAEAELDKTPAHLYATPAGSALYAMDSQRYNAQLAGSCRQLQRHQIPDRPTEICVCVCDAEWAASSISRDGCRLRGRVHGERMVEVSTSSQQSRCPQRKKEFHAVGSSELTRSLQEQLNCVPFVDGCDRLRHGTCVNSKRTATNSSRVLFSTRNTTQTSEPSSSQRRS